MTCSRTVAAWDATTLLPSTRLLLKRQELVEVEKALQGQREVRAAPSPVCPLPGHISAIPGLVPIPSWGALAIPQELRQRMERVAQRRQQLDQREEQLQDLLLKYEAFLKASAARRAQVLRQADTGQGARATHLHQELRGLLHRREHLARCLRSLRCFGEYLGAVLAHGGQFQDIPAMLARFRALVGARAALAQEAEAGRERLAQGWAQLRWYQEAAGSELLHTHTELAQLRARLEATRREVLQGESRWAHVQSVATQKTLLLGQIKLAVLNLFQLATAWLKVPTDVALEDTEAQLDTVPVSAGAALHAGPGCHLCQAVPQGARGVSGQNITLPWPCSTWLA
ncbi:cilia- and flagella-associated protein 73 [Aegotheles albertisi]